MLVTIDNISEVDSIFLSEDPVFGRFQNSLSDSRFTESLPESRSKSVVGVFM